MLRSPFFVFWSIFFNKKIIKNPLLEVDLIIPIIEKDLATLHLTIQSCKKNIEHKIKDIYLIAPDSKCIIDFCCNNNLIFVHEREVLGYDAKKMNYILKDGQDRSGWIFQQLLKLSGSIGTVNHFIVIDSDHVLLKPHTFMTLDGKYVLYKSNEFHYQYYSMNKKLLGKWNVPMFSYVTHKMIFNKQILLDLHKSLEASFPSMKWDQVIASNLNNFEPSCFSEFELYGSYLSSDKRIFFPWKQKVLNRHRIVTFEQLQQKIKGYWSVTFPSYLN